MNIKQWLGIEKRASYTDLLTEILVSRAAATSIVSAYSAAIETAKGTVARGFAAGEATGDEGLLTPYVLSLIGSDLIERGEAVFYLVENRLLRVSHYDILKGGRYQFDYTPWRRPSEESKTVNVTPRLILHVFSGNTGLNKLTGAVDFLKRMESKLRDEANASVGQILPVPADPDDDGLADLQTQIRNLQGKTFLAETTSDGFGLGKEQAPLGDWQQKRLGPMIPEGNVKAYEAIERTVLASSGVPIELVTESQGTAAREAWRRFLFGTLFPMSRYLITAMADLGNGYTVKLDFQNLQASDVVGRARSVGTLVQAGVELDLALEHAGFIDTESE